VFLTTEWRNENTVKFEKATLAVTLRSPSTGLASRRNIGILLPYAITFQQTAVSEEKMCLYFSLYTDLVLCKSTESENGAFSSESLWIDFFRLCRYLWTCCRWHTGKVPTCMPTSRRWIPSHRFWETCWLMQLTAWDSRGWARQCTLNYPRAHNPVCGLSVHNHKLLMTNNEGGEITCLTPRAQTKSQYGYESWNNYVNT
jgi:hypothetical protein